MKSDNSSGWERGRRAHFDQIVESYDKIRWEYPRELFEDAVRYSGLGKGKKAIEIGAGTGKATTPILSTGCYVTAVELGGNMAAFLRDKFKGYTNFNVVVSAFEDAVLEDNSYDLVYAASSFHWVDSGIGCPKVFRLLKSGGAFILFRNNAVPAVGEAFYEEIQEFYDKHYYSYHKGGKRPSKKSRDEFAMPAEIKRGFGFEDLRSYGFEDVEMKFYDMTRLYSADEYLTLLDTFSDHSVLPEESRAALYAGIKQVILRYGNRLKADYVFQLYMGRKV